MRSNYAPIHAPAPALTPRLVCTVSYKCRDIGYGIEEGVIDCYWTGDVDTWGKYTLQPVGGGDPIYLFADEILTVED